MLCLLSNVTGLGRLIGSLPDLAQAGDIDLDGDGEISFEEFRQMMEEDHTIPVATAASSGSGTPTSTGA